MSRCFFALSDFPDEFCLFARIGNAGAARGTSSYGIKSLNIQHSRTVVCETIYTHIHARPAALSSLRVTRRILLRIPTEYEIAFPFVRVRVDDLPHRAIFRKIFPGEKGVERYFPAKRGSQKILRSLTWGEGEGVENRKKSLTS